MATSTRWPLRSVPSGLVERYRAQGWWADDTLGTVVAHGLGSMADVGFRVRSKVRPWHLAAAGLARQKWPEALYQLADFPRTPSGKIQKFVLRHQIGTGRLLPSQRRER